MLPPPSLMKTSLYQEDWLGTGRGNRREMSSKDGGRKPGLCVLRCCGSHMSEHWMLRVITSSPERGQMLLGT